MNKPPTLFTYIEEKTQYHWGNFVSTWKWNKNCPSNYLFHQSNKWSYSLKENSMMMTINNLINHTTTLIFTLQILVSYTHINEIKFTMSIHSITTLTHRDHCLFSMSSCAISMCCWSLSPLSKDSSQKSQETFLIHGCIVVTRFWTWCSRPNDLSQESQGNFLIP